MTNTHHKRFVGALVCLLSYFLTLEDDWSHIYFDSLVLVSKY